MPLNMKELARRGAEARIQELEEEIGEIRREFPDLLNKRRGRPAGQPTASARNGVAPRGRQRRMSAAQRKAVSERMRRYWAERRRAKGSTKPSAAGKK